MTDLPLVEICVDTLDGALAAERGGAGRIELCADLVVGGTTPSAASIEMACTRLGIPIAVMIRPGAGDFLYTELERAVMLADIERVKGSGAAAVVFGVLTAGGQIDTTAMRELTAAARPLEVTCHRAFDMTHDPLEALDALIELGVDRVLTSGQEWAAPMAADLLRDLVQRAAGRISVMPGAGIEVDQVGELLRATGAREIHFSAAATVSSGMHYRNPRLVMGAESAPSEFDLQITDEAKVRRYVEAVRTGSR